jgi:hypothetical protein
MNVEKLLEVSFLRVPEINNEVYARIPPKEQEYTKKFHLQAKVITGPLLETSFF